MPFQTDTRKVTTNNWKTDVTAGIIGYLTTVYIVVVNGSILSEAGITLGEGMMVTIMACFAATLIMGGYANLPLILIPGMGINALFAYSIISQTGLDFREGLAVVFIAALLFLVIAFSPLGHVLKDAISDSLKHAITAGLGCFLILIGLEKSGLVINGENTLIALGDFTSPRVIVSVITLFVAIYLFIKNVPGHFLITMVAGTILAYMAGVLDTGSSQPSAQVDHFLFIPSFSAMNDVSFWMAIFPLTMILVFENMGLLHGQLYMLEREESFHKAYQVTALSSLMCAFLGTSPTVSAAENAAVIASKGKTKIAAFTASALFLATMVLLPWISMIPNTAISAILIIVGVIMAQTIKEIPLDDMSEALPAVFIIVMIPFTYSIADGMAFGFIAYAIGKAAMGRYRDLSLPFLIIAMLFLIILGLKAIGF
ncbi:NCS2 family permease [Lentibacillus halophilus]|uniref:NCS2 family permease n=1 Tax=Lentibacillus halophilus TaxID=295065 RepID=A0ABP3IYW2_9BACI